jgi:hypothetical protein
MAAVLHGAAEAGAAAIASHSYALPQHSLSKINHVDLYPCRPTIRPLRRSHDKIDGAPRQLISIWPTEGHRLNGHAIQRESQACVATIPHQAHRGERNTAQKEGGLRVTHTGRREMICECGKVCWGAAADRRREVYRQLWRPRFGLTCTRGADLRK